MSSRTDAAYRYTVIDRATALLDGGYREDEVVSNLAVEFTFDEFQLEDLPKLVKHVNQRRSERMTKLEAHNIKAQLFTTRSLLEDLAENYPESLQVGLAADKLNDAEDMIAVFLSGLIFRD